MTSQYPISEDDLHAYVDGALLPERLAAVEAYLAANPEAARDVADWKAQRADLKALYASVGTDAVKRTAAIPATRRLWTAGAGAGLFAAGLAIGILLGPRLHLQDSAASVALGDWAQTNFLVYASEKRHPVEVGKDQEDHLLQWLSKRFGEPVKAPDLMADGFDLIGGRLVTYDGKPAALLMYENTAGERLTLALGRNASNTETGFLLTEREGVRTFHWIDGPVGYAVSGRIDSTRLKDIATKIYEQL